MPQHPDNPLAQQIRLRTTFARSVNLIRDRDALDLIGSYLPTSRALEALRQLAHGLAPTSHQRALALIGPYGAGKSAFALFAGALLAAHDSPLQQTATAILHQADPALAARIRQAVHAPRGFLRVQINGLPDSLSRQLMLALALAAEQHDFAATVINRIRAAARAGVPMDHVLELVEQVRTSWVEMGGAGVLIEIDELGKFLEYESYHPQHREIHLLQLLAEQAAAPHPAPTALLVMLHQSFEQYGSRLGSHLRDEWQKVQGRFGTIAFLEPAEQSLRIAAAAFERDGPLSPEVSAHLATATACLEAESALPLGLERDAAQALFARCYPLHPLTLLILPVLCQKIAQNERTLFSYLASTEPFGLRQRLDHLKMGDWIGPWELYDYFISKQAGGFSDPLTSHRWIEAVTAQERFESANEGDESARQLLKTIGILNLIGAQRGLKASTALLTLSFAESTVGLLKQLEAASIIHFRQFAQEYRVWQGSDFDLRGALHAAAAEQAARPLADTLNQLSPLRPLVARRASIETGTLRAYVPAFTGRDRWPPKPIKGVDLTLWFYLAEPEEHPDLSATPALDVVAVCRFTERLREVVADWVALSTLPRHHAALQQDPVAQREYQTWLTNAESEAVTLIRTLIEAPEELAWFFGGERRTVRDRRDLQRQLSAWIIETCYPQAPWIRNELINRERPSASAATGRKRLLAAMLNAPERAYLGIDKAPAEKSLYLSLLKDSGLHRVKDDQRGFFAPPVHDPCHLRPLWDAITDTLGRNGQRQVPLPELYARLQQPPLGARLGILPILLVAYLLAHRRETGLYQEGAFCETLTLEQVELLCRRPALFAVERFALAGLRGELFDRYLSSVVGEVRGDSLLDIARPLLRFATKLPEYTQHCTNLSTEAEQVRKALRHAKSPGVLLFDDLPRACGVAPDAFIHDEEGVVEHCIQRLIQVLRELRDAYPNLLTHWRQALGHALLDHADPALEALRERVARRYAGLDRYAPELSPASAFVRRLADTGFATDMLWLESVMTLLGGAPPAKWRESHRLQATLRLADFASQMHDLERLRQAMPDADAPNDAQLIKLIDVSQGEISRVIQLSSDQRQTAADRATDIAHGLADLDDTLRLAIVAALLEKVIQPSIGHAPHSQTSSPENKTH